MLWGAVSHLFKISYCSSLTAVLAKYPLLLPCSTFSLKEHSSVSEIFAKLHMRNGKPSFIQSIDLMWILSNITGLLFEASTMQIINVDSYSTVTPVCNLAFASAYT